MSRWPTRTTRTSRGRTSVEVIPTVYVHDDGRSDEEEQYCGIRWERAARRAGAKRRHRPRIGRSDDGCPGPRVAAGTDDGIAIVNFYRCIAAYRSSLFTRRSGSGAPRPSPSRCQSESSEISSPWVVVSFSSCSCSQSWARRGRFQRCTKRQTLHEPFRGHITERTLSTRFPQRASARTQTHASPSFYLVSRYLPVFTGASSGCCPARFRLYSFLSTLYSLSHPTPLLSFPPQSVYSTGCSRFRPMSDNSALSWSC